MKTFYFYSFLFLFLISCNNSDVNPINKSNKIRSNETINQKNDILLEMTSPSRHFYSPCPDQCFPTAHDCFPDIVVTPPNLSFIKELDSLIQVNHTYKFFQLTGNYEELFPGLFGPAFDDLVQNITTLRKGISSDSTIFYHIVFVNDTSLAPDYSDDY